MENKNSYLWLFVAAIVVAGLSSCGKSKPFEFVPFHAEDDDWGMMSLDGEVLFEDEFKEKPTYSYNGIFLVKNKKDQWEYYTAEEKPRQIGDDSYVEATWFSKGGVAVVAREGKCVEVIDRDGNVKFSLDKFDGKRVKCVSMFNDDGLAVVTLENGKQGLVNESGDVVLSPKYCNMEIGDYYGSDNNKYIIAMDAKYMDDYFADETIGKWLILDRDGKVCSELPRAKYNSIMFANDNLFIVKQGDDKGFGIIDKDGEFVVKPSSKYQLIAFAKDKKFMFINEDEKCGVCGFDGDVKLKAKYDGMAFITDNRLIVSKDDVLSIIDLEGKQLNSTKFDDLEFFFYGSDRLILRKGKKYYCVDVEGNETKLSDIELDGSFADSSVDSQVYEDEYDDD